MRLHVRRRRARARRHLRRHATALRDRAEPLGTAGSVRLAYDEGLLAERLSCSTETCSPTSTSPRESPSTDAQRGAGDACAVRRRGHGELRGGADGRGRAGRAFLEKAAGEAPTNRINAGAYVIEREVVESIPVGPGGLDRARGVPALVGHGLQGYEAAGYWIDIGTPRRDLEATWDLLAGRVHSELPPRDETGSLVYDGCLVSGAHVGPQSVLGRHCSRGSRLACGDAVSTTACPWGPTPQSSRACSPRACGWVSARGSSPAR